MRRFSRWGLESGGLRAGSIGLAQLVLLVVASTLSLQLGWRIDAASYGVVFIALELGFMRGLLLCALVGYLADLFGGQPQGLWMAGAVASFAALRLFVFRIAGAGALTVALLTAFAVGVAGLTRLILLRTLGQSPSDLGALFGLVLGTAVVAPLTHRLFAFASDRFKKRDEQLFNGG